MHFVFKAAILVATCLTPALARAQTSTESDVVITATRHATENDRLPADVTVIDADVALSQGLSTLAQAIEATPGLGIVQSGGAGQQTSIFAGGANSNHTLVLFDGLRLNDPSTPGSSFDAGQDQINALARIEIVEGPMSAAFGSDAIGGVVNLIPRRGGDGAFNARLDMSAGSFGALTSALGVDGTLSAFRYAVTAEAFATDGYDLVPERIVTHTGDEDSAESTTFTGVFDVALNDRFSVDLLVRHREARADFDALAYEFVFPFREYRLDDPDLEIARNDLTVARLGATWAVNDALSFRTTVGGTNQTREQTDAGALTDGFEGQRRFTDFTLDWQIGALGNFEDTVLVLGVAGEREEIDAAQGYGFPPPFAFLNAEQDQRSVFATAQGALQAVTLNGALRVDDYEGFGSHLTGRLGASFNATSNLRIYGAYGTSFRAPTVYERFVSFGDPDLDPEHGETWEVGAQTQFDMFGLEAEALYRRTEIEDLIDFGMSNYENIDRAEIETIETRIGVRPVSWFSLQAGYIYTDAQDAIANTQLLRRPENAWTAAAEVTHGGFTGRVAWRSVGDRNDVLYGDDSFSAGIGLTPAYDLTRLSLAYAFASGAEAYIAADNLFDATYEPVNGYAGAPQSVTLGLRLRTQ